MKRKTLWFVVPAHGRLELSAICLAQLRQTCDTLTGNGVEATAVVIACDENLDTARDLGFGTVERDNRFLSRRYNDGIQLALDSRYNSRPADYVVPCGSDDWVAPSLFLELPPPNTVLGFPRLSFVRPDGREIAETELDYAGGAGIRVFPRGLMAAVRYRPADEDRVRACDTSILTNLQRAHRQLRIEHRIADPRSIVDWKSASDQVTNYETIIRRHRPRRRPDPFAVLAGFYPAEALEAMRSLYADRGAAITV